MNTRTLTSAALALTLGLALCVPARLAAQASAGGSIRGRVTDASGGTVIEAIVTVTSPSVAGTFKAQSDSEGNYRILDVPPAADYTVTAEHTGFSKFERKGLTVRAGLNVALDIDLKVGNVNQTVEVSADDTPLLDTFSSEQTVNIGGEMIRGLPLTGRREWSDALQLTPGILSASTDNYGGQVYFTRGSENENHATLLDGVDIGSFKQNWPSNFIAMSTESLGDIQVKTGASEASNPSAMGMVISMATPTGGDTFHGALSFLIAPRSLNGNNTPGGISAVSEAYQPDFAISGPIKKGRAWFFGSGRYIYRNDGISRTATQLSRVNLAYPDFKPFDNEARGFIYTANSTFQISDKHKLFGLVQYDSRTQGGNVEEYVGDFGTQQYGGGAYMVRLTSLWTPKLTSRLMVGYNNKGQNDSLDAIGGIPNKPSVNVYLGVNPSNGRLSGNTLLATINNLASRSVSPAHKATISGDITYYVSGGLGSHEVQTGFYFQPRASTKSTTYYANGGFSMENAVMRDPANAAAGFIPFQRRYVDAPNGLVTSYIGADDYAYYFQDRWRPTSRLTITAGLRADYVASQDWIFHVTTSSAWNYAPRIGGAYVLTKDRRHVVRASWSRVTDIPNAGYFGDAGSSVAASRDEYDLDLNGSFETVFTTPASSAVATNRSLDPNRHQGYAQEWIAGYRTHGENAPELVDRLRVQEEDIGKLSSRYLTEGQLKELRDAIDSWRQTHPTERLVSMIRLADFPQAKSASAGAQGPTSVFGLLFIDPLAGLEPTRREVQESREAVERMFFYMQRLPVLLSWRVEAVSRVALDSPQLQQFVDNTSSYAETAKTVAKLLERFPKELSEERQRAVDDVAQKTTQQRTAAVTQLAQAVASERDATLRQSSELVGAQRAAAVKQVADAVAVERDALLAASNTSLQSQREALMRDLEAATNRMTTRLFIAACGVVLLGVVLLALAALAVLALRGHMRRGTAPQNQANPNPTLG